jgi:hypothetical protein
VVRYAVVLAKFIDLTGSLLLSAISGPDPAVVASARHVLRTLVTGGRALDRLLSWAGPGSTEWLAAFAAPMVLRMLRILPARARTDVDTLVQQAARELPLLEAGISFAEFVPSELRRYFAVDGLQLFADAAEEEKAVLRSAITDWSAMHAEEAFCLAAAATKAA